MATLGPIEVIVTTTTDLSSALEKRDDFLTKCVVIAGMVGFVLGAAFSFIGSRI